MRIAELSHRTGIPVPTIKYYLREGLLPPGELTSRNQASYDEPHVRRLQLIRALLEIGRLPIASIKAVLAEVDAPTPNLHHALGRALQADLIQPEPEENGEEVDALIALRGWQVGHDTPARRKVADIIAAFRRLGWHDMVDNLDSYADIADRTAELDLGLLRTHADPEEIVYGAVVGTILGDALLVALRRLAQESASMKLYGLNQPAG